MRWIEINEDFDSDDELFGNPRHVLIAQALYDEAERELETAAEERSIGDKLSAADWIKQSNGTKALAREFSRGLHNGITAWRKYKGFDRAYFRDIVEQYTGLDLDEISDLLKEDTDPSNDDLFVPLNNIYGVNTL